MCIISKSYYFRSFDYSLILNLNKSGNLDGFLTTSSDYRSTLRGYYLNQNGLVRLTFTVDWTLPDDKNWGFTCFSGHFVNDHILVTDWMLVENANDDNFGITGCDYLCSSLYLKERITQPNHIKPFPIDVELLKGVKIH